jgi:hypothetical protein
LIILQFVKEHSTLCICNLKNPLINFGKRTGGPVNHWWLEGTAVHRIVLPPQACAQKLKPILLNSKFGIKKNGFVFLGIGE